MKTLMMLTAAASLLATAAPASAMVTANTVEGTLHTYCMNGAASCRALIDIGGKSYTIQAPFKEFAGLDGATVKMHGTIDVACPGGGTCSNFTPTSKKIDIFGTLAALYTAEPLQGRPMVPTAGNYLLSFGNGKSIVISSKENLMADNHETVWLRGRVKAGGGDLAPFFVATSAYRFQNWSGVSSGSNVSRDSHTTPVGNSTAQSAPSTGAGIRR